LRTEATERPHVGYVLKRFPWISEAWIADELIELERQGTRVTIFAMNPPTEPVAHGFLSELSARVVYLPYRPLREPARVARALFRVLGSNPRGWLRGVAALRAPRVFGLRKLMRATVLLDELTRAGVDHVHVHFANKAARLANLTWRMGGPAYSVTAHGKDIWHGKVDMERLRETLTSAAVVATVSEDNVRHLNSVLGGRRPVHLVPNAADVAQLGPPRREPAEPDLVLSVARLVEKKGLADLIEACALLAARSLPVRLEIVGGGPLRRDLEAAARRARVPTTFHGKLPRERVLELYRRAAVHCLPCVVAADGDRDGLPTSVLEAMALGVPVVTTDVNGLKEAVIDGRTGVTVPEHSPPALADALERVLRNPALATALADEARGHVEARFTRERSVSLLRSLFEAPTSDIGRGRGGGPASRTESRARLRRRAGGGCAPSPEALAALYPTPDELERLGLASGALRLHRAWPRGRDRLLLEYRTADGHLVAGQWLGDTRLLERVAAETAARGPVARVALGGAGSPVVLLQAGGADRRLPGLAPLLARPDARLLAHRAERRAVVRLDGPGAPRYAKVVRRERTQALAAVAHAARNLAAGAFEVPLVVDTEPDAGVITFAAVPGVTLHELLATDEAIASMPLVGEALRALQAASPPPAAVHGAPEEAGVLRSSIERLEPYSPDLCVRVRAAAPSVLARLAATPADGWVPAHRDLHDKQLLLDAAGRVGMLDFDNLARGDPALDLANLLVHLELREEQGLCSRGWTAEAASGLLEGYGPVEALRPSIEAYGDATRLRLACLYAFRPRWTGISTALLHRIGGPLPGMAAAASTGTRREANAA